MHARPRARFGLGFAVVATAGALAAQPPMVRIDGRVFDPHTRPVAGAVVTAEVDGEVVARAASDGSGIFLLPRLPRAEVVVRAVADGPDAGAVALDLRRGFPVPALVRIGPVRAVRGRVVDAAGQPVAGAWVAVAPAPAPDAMPRVLGAAPAPLGTATRTAAEGTFALAQVPCGTVRVCVWAAGHGGVVGEVDGSGDVELPCALAAAPEEPLRFVLRDANDSDRATAWLSVRAPDGVPLPPELRRLAPVGDEFPVWGWPHGEALLGAIDLPGAFVEPRAARGAVGQGIAGRFWCEYGPDTRVRGRVVLPDGAPAPGVVVRVGTWTVGEAVFVASATTADDGRFEVVAPATRGKGFLLAVDDERFAVEPGPTHVVQLFEPCPEGAVHLVHRPDDELVVRLAPRASFAARVVDGAGQPVAGAAVEVFGGKTFAATRGGAKLPQFVANLAARLATGHTRADGAIVLSPFAAVAGTEVRLRVHGPDGYVSTTVASDETLSDLVAAPPATLAGHVHDTDGRPVAGALLHVTTMELGDVVTVCATDRDGRFTLAGLPPGPAVVARLGGGGTARVVQLEAGVVAEVRWP